MLRAKVMRLIAVVLVCVVACLGCYRGGNEDLGAPSAKKIFLIRGNCGLPKPSSREIRS
jgi:hypothetical protein